MGKTIEVECSQAICAELLTALRNYIDVAFPPGAADCALVARASLLDALRDLQASHSSSGRCAYNKRLRAMLKEGVRLHFRLLEADTGESHVHRCQVLLDVCQGEARTDADMQRAAQSDTGAPPGLDSP